MVGCAAAAELAKVARWGTGNLVAILEPGEPAVIEQTFPAATLTTIVLDDKAAVLVRIVVHAGGKDGPQVYSISRRVPDRGMLVVVDQRPIARAVAATWAGGEVKELDLEDCAIVLLMRPRVVVAYEVTTKPPGS